MNFKKYSLDKALNMPRMSIKGVGMRNIKAPGSRGGVGYWNGKGEWVYGSMPMGKYTDTTSSGARPIIQKPNVDPVAYTEKLLTKNTEPWTFISGHLNTRQPEANHQMHQNLIREIQRRGYRPMDVTGYYTYQGEEGKAGGVSEEPSYLIPGMSTKEAIELGHSYDQQAILTHEGIFNVEDTNYWPLTSKRFIRGEIPKDQDQSVVNTPGGAKNTFLINADWEHPQQSPLGLHPHLGKGFGSTRLGAISRPIKYMIAAEIIFNNDNKKKNKKKNEL